MTIPAEDAALVREVAAVLRTGGDQARRVRQTLRPLVSTGVAKSGSDLVAFFRGPPLAGVELAIERVSLCRAGAFACPPPCIL